ncbi:hypothetical protein [Aurantiacibacter rhizosphaerae]|uniref:Uncharacterized protein n=1 Tax=Aurantiacibacter rhizosphaerae TaxID=2691582 RepID=A0A844XGN3_9SPHN|nr:hypothetical protein [Aurantiacibacter rhizosphaerae]MWV28744.1 hypothetical protein [Aurantiacibacter rhizosphaerae]
MMFVPFLASILWMGWSGGGKHFEQPPDQVRASLKQASVPLHVLGSYVMGSRVTTPDDNTIVTALLDENHNELMRFVTTVEADGTGSLVDTEIEPPQGENAERAVEAMKKQGYAVSLLALVADEHVAAAIEKRPFNMLAMNPAANAMIGAMPDAASEVESANRAADEWSRSEQGSYAAPSAVSGWGDETGSSADDWGVGY